jgi:hypothetical protein
MKNRQKSPKKYHCKKCDYTSSNKYDFNKHLSTAKHIRKQMETNRTHKKRNICCCKKAYKTRSGLFKHKKKCTYTVVNPVECEMVSQPDEKEVLIILNTILKDNQSILKENRELRNEMKNMKINNNTINNNQKYNINVFLNEHCKDAMCMEDFMNKLQLTLRDVKKTVQLGFTEGVSNILIKNLNDLPVIQRPIHCSDVKRQKFYIKDKEGWNIDASNQKVDKAIEEIFYKQIHKIKDWQKENPDWSSNDKKLKEWQQMVKNLSGPTNDGDMEKETKTIKRKIGENIGIKEAMATVE